MTKRRRFARARRPDDVRATPTTGEHSTRLRAWWRDLSLRRKVVLVMLLPLLATGGAVTASVVVESGQEAARNEVERTYAVRELVAALLNDMLDAETGVRGFLATKDARFLAPYEGAVVQLPRRFTAIRARVRAPDVAARLDRAEKTALRELRTLAELRRSVDAAPERRQALLERGKATMDELRAQLAAVQQREQELLAERRAHAHRAHQLSYLVYGASAVLGLLGVAVALRLLGTGVVRRIEALDAYAAGLGEEGVLEDPPAGGDEVGVLGRRLAHTSDVLRGQRASLREARDLAEEANRSKTEFLSRMSHELRTPLNAIIGFSQLLTHEELTDDQRDSVEHVLKAGRHLLQLIDEVLDISRIESGSLALSVEPVAVADAVQRAIDLVAPLAGERGVTVAVEEADPDLYAVADNQRIVQVLLNLLANAIKYNREGGSVTVRTEARDDRIRLSIVDSGIGIPAERMGRLFSPFDRLGAEATAIEGTGVGLALSKQFVEAMGGTIGATSVDRVGSTFWLELGRAPAPLEFETAVAASSAPQQQVGDGGASGRILYVEDNLANLVLVRRIVRQRPDVELVAAMEGGLGLQLAQEQRPDLVLLDQHLPDMTGRDVLEGLRSRPETASVPVVMLSADARPSEMKATLAAGATAYLTKPLDVDELLTVLDDLLAPQRA